MCVVQPHSMEQLELKLTLRASLSQGKGVLLTGRKAADTALQLKPSQRAKPTALWSPSISLHL